MTALNTSSTCSHSYLHMQKRIFGGRVLQTTPLQAWCHIHTGTNSPT